MPIIVIKALYICVAVSCLATDLMKPIVSSLCLFGICQELNGVGLVSQYFSILHQSLKVYKQFYLFVFE